MQRSDAPVSLADLSAAGVRLRPFEAVTLVREFVLQVSRGDVVGVPSSHVIRLSASGAVSVEGPVGAGGPAVVRAAQLLNSLLPASDAGDEFRIPGGLKLVVARALGTLDLPPFTSLESFAEALSRFSASDPAAMVTNLMVTWSESVNSRTPDAGADERTASAALVEPFVAPKPIESRGPGETTLLTVSDVRRARRATGMPLAQVADRSRIPIALLRQLEWGYLHNWPTGHYGKTQLVRYARATGLDERLVIATIEPLLEQAELRRALLVHKPPVPAPVAPREATVDPIVVEIEDIVLAPAPPLPWAKTVDPRAGAPRARSRALAALAVPALLAISLIPAWWAYSVEPSPGPAPAIEQPAAEQSTASALLETQSDESRAEAAAPPADAGLAEPSSPGLATSPEPEAAADPAYRLASDDGAFSPSLASVGTAMFYHAEGDGRTGLVRANRENRGSVLRITRIVDDAARNFHVRPSPDGGRIAFDSDRGGVRGVYVADADGSNVRRVSPDGFAAVPSWSPDGSMLAFVREEEARNDVWNLWTLDLSTGDLKQVTHHSYGQPWGGSWFPDGRRIAYNHEDRLIVRNLDTGDDRVFGAPRSGRLVRTPAVSPDGSRVMFQVEGDGAWILELGDGSMRRVLEDPTAEEYTWSPDGRRVAYHSGRSDTWSVWVMAPH
ncbi:MAG: helix-turn-helix domain-containing protein [Vicinamibacterales bacterium]